MPYELPQNRVAAAGGVSGSVKPLPPFAPNPLAIAYRERYKALVVAAAKAYGGSTRFFLACGPMSSDYCSEVEWVINQTNAVGIKSYLLNQVCLLVPSVSSCPRGSTAPFLRPAHSTSFILDFSHADETALRCEIDFFSLPSALLCRWGLRVDSTAKNARTVTRAARTMRPLRKAEPPSSKRPWGGSKCTILNLN